MSNPYQLTPGRLPAAPHPTPTSVAGYTLPNPKIGRAPIANPYDKFTQPEFDAWIGGITGALKRALGHDEGLPQVKRGLSERDGIPQFRPIDLPDDSDNDGIDDSFAEIKARRAAGKGKARDPREGPGFGKTTVSQPIEILSSDEEEEEEEVEHSILHPNDSDVEEEPEDTEGEIEEDEEYPWSTVERSPNVGSSPPDMGRNELEGDGNEYDEDEEAEYEEYDEEAESEDERQEQGRPEDEVIELLSDDEEPSVPPPNKSHPADVEEERYNDEEYYPEEEAEEYEVEDAEEDQDREGARSLQRDEYVIEDDEGEIGEFQYLEDDNSFASQNLETIATTPTHRVMSVEMHDVRSDPEVHAEDHNLDGQLQTLSQREPSHLGVHVEVSNETLVRMPLESDQIEEEFRYLDTEAENTRTTRHEFSQHANHPEFVDQAKIGGHLGPLSMPLHHIQTGSSPVGELSFDRELVEPAEEHYIQPSEENTSFPLETGQRDDHLVQIPDPWRGPREYAQDFYAGGDIRPTTGAHLDADHLGPEDEDHVEESEARKEQEAEDNAIQPEDRDTAFLHNDVRAGPVEIPDMWEGVETYAQDYYSDGVHGALPTDRIDPAFLPVTGETGGYSSFLAPYAPAPSQPVETSVEDRKDEGKDGDRFVLPPAPEGIYIPPSLRARDAPIPADAEIFNVDDSDDEEAGNPVPITEYSQDIETRADDMDDELEYVDEGMDVAEDIVSAPEVASRDMQDQFEPRLEQGQELDELIFPEQSRESFPSAVDWNNPPAFLDGVPASASGHPATPPSAGDDQVAAQGPATVNDHVQQMQEEVAQDDLILAEKEESGPPLPDDIETSFQQSIPEQITASESEPTDLVTIALGEAPVVSSDVTEHLSEEIGVVQEPTEPSTQSDVIDVDMAAGADGLTDMAPPDISEATWEVDQTISAMATADEPPSPIDVEDDKSKLTELEPIVEEFESVSGSRAGTASLLDLSVKELDHNAFISQEKDAHLIVGIVEDMDVTASPQETPDREILSVDVIEEHIEDTFLSEHPPISAVHHSPHSDYLSEGDYSSDGELDELDEDEPERPNEDIPSSVTEVFFEETAIAHQPADGQASFLVPGDATFPTNAEIGSGAPFGSVAGGEVLEGNVDGAALSLDVDDTGALGDADLPPLNLAGEENPFANTPAGNEPTVQHPVGPDLASPVEANLETDVLAVETLQDSSQQTMPEGQKLAVDFAAVVSPDAPVADNVKPSEDLDSHADESATGGKTPVQKPFHLPAATPESVSTDRYPGVVFKTPERYTPSPPKVSPPKTSPPQAESFGVPQAPPFSDAAAQGQLSSPNDASDTVRTQEDLKGVPTIISPGPKPQTQPISTTNVLSTHSHQFTSPQQLVAEPPAPAPYISLNDQVNPLHNQQLNNPQLFSSQPPLAYAPAISEQFHQQTHQPLFSPWDYPPPLFGAWPYGYSAPGAQQQPPFTPVNPPVIPAPKSRKKLKSMGASPKSPKKGKKAAQHKSTEALTHTIPEIKTTITQADSLGNKEVAQSSSEGVRRPADLQGTSKGLYGQEDLVKDNHLPHVTALESTSIISKVEGMGVPKQEQQKPKRTYNKRKRAPSPGPGESQVGKTDEKKVKRPTKRKSKLLELEGPIPGPSNGETIHVKARPKGTSPVEPSQAPPSPIKETNPKSKKGLLSAQSASLPGSIASQTPRPEVLLITRAGPPGISHRHGADHSLTIPPAAPSFKALLPRTISPKKAPIPQSLTQTQAVAVAQPGPSSALGSPTLAPWLNTSAIADTVLPTSSAQPLEPKSREILDVSTTQDLPKPSPGSVPTLPAPTTQTLAQLSEVITASSDPQKPLDLLPASTKPVSSPNKPTVTAATAPALGVPSSSVVGPKTASVSNIPASQASTPKITMRETRSTCRYHRISLPKEEGGPRVRFLVPGCAMTNDILMKEQEIVDHGLAPVEDAYVMIKDIESLDLSPDLISVLRVLVGHDIFRDQELFYLPAEGEQLPVRPAFRKPTQSDRLESARHNASSPGYSSLAGSPTFHKSSASVSGSTSSLSALRKAQTSDWGSNLAPTDSEEESEDDDVHSKASHQGSDSKGKGKLRTKSGRKSKLSRDPDFVPIEDKLSDAERGSRKRRRPTGAKRGVKRTRTEAPVGEDPSRENKKLKVNPTAPASLASPEKPQSSNAPANGLS